MNINTGFNPQVRVQYGAQYGTQYAGQPAAPPTPQNPGGGTGFLDVVTKGLVTATYEAGAVLENDPALAVREFATRVHEGASRGYGSSDLAAWAPFVGVGARTLILGANVIRAKKTLGASEGAGLLEKGGLLEKSLDVTRVATDLLGVAGAMIRIAMPSKAALGTTLMGIAQSADLVSHGARFGFHSAPRAKVWLKDREEAKAREREKRKKADEALGINQQPVAPVVVAQMKQLQKS